LLRAVAALLTSTKLFVLFKSDESVFEDVIVGSRELAIVPELILTALVVSVVAEAASPVIWLALGCMHVGMPLALIAVVNLFDAQAPPVIDPPPPLVVVPPPGTKPPPPIGPAHALLQNAKSTSVRISARCGSRAARSPAQAGI
jgi:hypothetical protein